MIVEIQLVHKNLLHTHKQLSKLLSWPEVSTEANLVIYFQQSLNRQTKTSQRSTAKFLLWCMIQIFPNLELSLFGAQPLVVSQLVAEIIHIWKIKGSTSKEPKKPGVWLKLYQIQLLLCFAQNDPTVGSNRITGCEFHKGQILSINQIFTE